MSAQRPKGARAGKPRRRHAYGSRPVPAPGARPLTMKQIGYFVSAVELGSMTAAAEVHGITVQGLSQALADVEDEVGAVLLERGKKGVSPTPFGEELYALADELLYRFDEFESFARSRGHQA